MKEVETDADFSPAAVMERGLAAERSRNCRVLNRLRFISISAFFALQAVLSQLLPQWQTPVWPYALYWVLAGTLFLLGQRYRRFDTVMQYAMPVLDSPMVFLLLLLSAQAGSAPATLSFGTALFAFLIILTSLSLRKRLIWLQAVVGAGFQVALLSTVSEVSVAGRWVPAILLLLVAAACSYLVHRVIALIGDISQEQVRRERLGRYFSPAVASLVGESGQHEVSSGALCEITILISDIRGFTAMSEGMEGQRVVAFLNDYLERMVDVIFANEGTLDKFMGDGILAYFGAPLAEQDHARQALDCALGMQAAVAKLNTEREARGEVPIVVGVGLHSGPAIVGDIGSPRRREYTVVGDSVNLASRIEGLTKSHDRPVLVSHTTWEQLRERVDFEAMPEVEVKGKTRPVKTYAPRPRTR